MYIKKLLVFIILILLLTSVTQAASAAINHPLELTFAGQRTGPEIQAIEINGEVFINLPFLSKFFNVITAWDIERSDLFLKLGKVNIKLYAGSSTYYVDGGRRQLTTAPFEKNGQFWLPLQFLTRLSLVVKKLTTDQLALDWDGQYLLDIEPSTYHDRPAILLMVTPGLTIKDNSSANDPQHLTLELPDARAYFALDISNKSNTLVKQIHYQQNQNNIELGLDLNQSSGYQIIPNPNQTNQFILVFNYSLNTIKLQTTGEMEQLMIQSSLPAAYQLKIQDAKHLVIDFEGATLATVSPVINKNDPWITFLRATQLDPQTVRLEIKFSNSHPYYVIRVPDNQNLIEIRTIRLIRQVNWGNYGSESRLTFVTDGEPLFNIQKTFNPDQLRIEMKYFRLAPQVKLPVIKNELIKAIHYEAFNPENLQITVDLKQFTDYETEISADNRCLIIHFRYSPLVGKTIIIDPGHGGEDLGACGRQGTQEKDNNLQIALRLKNLLEQAGATVVLTRTDDYFVGLYERAFLANYWLADLFISIHTNNHPDLNVHGIEVYYFQARREAKELAQDILAKAVDNSGLVGLGVKTDNFVVIRESQMPGILIEVGYLSNFQEENTIRTPEFKDHMAMGIFQGITIYYHSK